MTSKCPCDSGLSLDNCCKIIHKGQKATNALSLMRSRYTAYTMGLSQYIMDSTHSKTRNQYTLNGIEQWANQNQWDRLEIIHTAKGKETDESGIVEFKAYFQNQHGANQIHHEKSEFIKENDTWYFLEGEVFPVANHVKTQKISRNSPCPCGSGKKYKNCCG